MARIWLLAAVTGLAATSIACSDPVPPASQAAAIIHVKNGDSGSCPGQQRPLYLPYTGKPADALTGSGWGKLASNGQNSAEVDCSVKATGSGFSVRGNALIPSSVDAVNWGSVSVSINSISEGQTDATGTLTINSDQTGKAPYKGEDCKFSVAGGSGERLGVAAGRVWASVTCPVIADPNNVGGQSCQIGSSPASYILFQNCDQ